MQNIMVDLETMGTKSNAAIVGIGACEFDRDQVGKTFYRPVNLASSVARGLTMEPSTIMWWLGQSESARQAIRFGTYPLDQALTEFANWVLDCAPRDNVRIWAKGPTFDCAILAHAYGVCDIEKPWRFWNDRCVRTVIARNPSVTEPAREGTAHNAQDDAVHQAKWLIAIEQRRTPISLITTEQT